MKLIIVYGLAGMLASGTILGSAEGLIAGYALDGAGPFSAAAGRSAWQRQHAAHSRSRAFAVGAPSENALPRIADAGVYNEHQVVIPCIGRGDN